MTYCFSITMYDPVASYPVFWEEWPLHVFYQLVNRVKRVWQYSYSPEQVLQSFESFSLENVRCLTKEQMSALTYSSANADQFIKLVTACFIDGKVAKGLRPSDEVTFEKLWFTSSFSIRRQCFNALLETLWQNTDGFSHKKNALKCYITDFFQSFEDNVIANNPLQPSIHKLCSLLIFFEEFPDMVIALFEVIQRSPHKAVFLSALSSVELLQLFRVSFSFLATKGKYKRQNKKVPDAVLFREELLDKVNEHLSHNPSDRHSFSEVVIERTFIQSAPIDRSFTGTQFKQFMAHFTPQEVLHIILKGWKDAYVFQYLMNYVSENEDKFKSELCNLLSKLNIQGLASFGYAVCQWIPKCNSAEDMSWVRRVIFGYVKGSFLRDSMQWRGQEQCVLYDVIEDSSDAELLMPTLTIYYKILEILVIQKRLALFDQILNLQKLSTLNCLLDEAKTMSTSFGDELERRDNIIVQIEAAKSRKIRSSQES